jgi:hypothetical protein
MAEAHKGSAEAELGSSFPQGQAERVIACDLEDTLETSREAFAADRVRVEMGAWWPSLLDDC